jgi:pimeloyl-ACP methyl ester carboxylesterase
MPEALPYREHFITAEDGLRLYAREYGRDRPGSLPVICLPGLSRNCRDFHPLALHLSQDSELPRRVIAIDYRGRGGSEKDRDWTNYNALTEARDVAGILTGLGIEHAAFVGTSRGGIVTMMLSAIRPAAVAAVVLNDSGPVIEGAGIARIRQQLRKMPRPRSFEEAAALQRKANGGQFPALSDEDWQRQARATYRDHKGRPVPDFDPRLLKTLDAIDFSIPLPTLWPQFVGLAGASLMVIHGENSDVLSAQTVKEMKELRPDMTVVSVQGQGHPPLLETAGLPETISAFLSKVDRQRT